MSEVKIILPLKAFSINSMTYATKKIKTPEAREWTSKVCYALKNPEIQKQFSDIRNEFDPSIHAFEVNLLFIYPKSTLYTLENSVSAKSMDLSNVEKPIIDILFLPSFHNAVGSLGVKNMNVDDRFILNMTSRKRASCTDKYEIHVHIKIIPNEYENSQTEEYSLECTSQPLSNDS